MNALNQFIIEGSIKSVEPLRENSKGRKFIEFSIDVPRYFKDRSNEEVEEHSQFDCIVFDSMTDVTYEIGRGLRIVGRLKQEKWYDEKWHSRIVLLPEHIEFKPVKN